MCYLNLNFDFNPLAHDWKTALLQQEKAAECHCSVKPHTKNGQNCLLNSSLFKLKQNSLSDLKHEALFLKHLEWYCDSSNEFARLNILTVQHSWTSDETNCYIYKIHYHVFLVRLQLKWAFFLLNGGIRRALWENTLLMNNF